MEQIKPLHQVDIELNKALLIWYKKQFELGNSRFIAQHPTLEVLALSFLILIGFMLMVEAFGYEGPKGYIYFAVFFSLIVEVLNIRIKKNQPLSI